MATEQNQKRDKWLSSKLEAALMDELDEKAKSIGLSRSEAVRKAIKQWTEEPSEPAQPTDGQTEIITRLERIEQRIGGSEASHDSHEEAHEEAHEEERQSNDKEPREEGLGQMEMYEGDELLNWIEKEGVQPAQPAPPDKTTNTS